MKVTTSSWRDIQNECINKKCVGVYKRDNDHYVFYGDRLVEIKLADDEQVDQKGNIIKVNKRNRNKNYIPEDVNVDEKLTSCNPEVRNDPIYRQDRITRLENQIQNCKKTKKSALIKVTRLDIDIMCLIKKYGLKVYRAGENPLGQLAIHCPFLCFDSKICDNPVCRHIANENSLMKCGNCKLVRYCSKICQKADWPSHKKYCQDHANYNFYRDPFYHTLDITPKSDNI